MANEILGTRADTWRWNVSIEGAPGGDQTGIWDAKEGGDVDSEEFKFKPGGMQPPISLGGSKDVQNLTLRRNYRLARDHQRLSDFLIDAVGVADVTVSGHPMNHKDKKVWGKPLVYRGTLKRVSFPAHDSTSNDAGMIEIEVTIEGYPTGDRP